LPQTMAIIREEAFALRGYQDAADVLRTEQSVQMNEDLSGRKTISLRGGNADEVTVLYNGVRLNSMLDNVFDFSNIDPDAVERFEVVKGSHTALYGPGGLSGLINIQPRTRMDHHVRFQQRIGSYDSGQWGVSLYQPVGNLHPAYSYKTGASRRQFSGSDAAYSLINKMSNQQASLSFDLQQPSASEDRKIEALWLQSDQKYNNQRDVEKLDQRLQLASLSFHGDLGPFRALTMSTAMSVDREQQTFYVNYTGLRRDIENKTTQARIEKNWLLRDFELTAAYLYEHHQLEWQDQGWSTWNQNIDSRRQQHGAVAVAKFHAATGSTFMPYVDFDISLRHDQVNDKRTSGQVATGSAALTAPDHSWSATPLNFGLQGQGRKNDVMLSWHFNYGHNVRFPTLMQQMSLPITSSTPYARKDMAPEEVNSMEWQIDVTRHLTTSANVMGWQLQATFFKHYYKNKMRPWYSVGIPIIYYDYVLEANISGVEASYSVFMFAKKVQMDAGLVRYNLSDRAAFPFKFDTKFFVDFKFDHAGFSLQAHLYHEGEQLGTIRSGATETTEITLPGYSDLDLHLGKSMAWLGCKGLLRASLFNALNQETQLLGLTMRDRRYYLTVAVQY
jgi:outer membrane cobalamin receptor